MKINVNGTEHVCSGGTLSYERVCELAGKPGAKALTVVYSWRGPGDLSRKGTLTHGETVQVSDGMQFDAVFTGNA